jgi:hypothetical protein
VDCGAIAVLCLLAAAVVGVPHEVVQGWSIAEVTHAGRYLRARLAVDLFGVSEEEVRERAAASRPGT